MKRFSHIFDGLSDDQLADEGSRIKKKLTALSKEDKASTRGEILKAKLDEITSRRSEKEPSVSGDLSAVAADAKRLVAENEKLAATNEKLLAELATKDSQIAELAEQLAEATKPAATV